MAVSMAVVRVLQKQGGIDLAKSAKFVAGHSLGEYSALTAAGSLEIPVTAKLLNLRGQSMQKAVPVGIGAMAAVLGPSFEDVLQVAKDTACEVANDNSVGQVVISGNPASRLCAVSLFADGARCEDHGRRTERNKSESTLARCGFQRYSAICYRPRRHQEITGSANYGFSALARICSLDERARRERNDRARRRQSSEWSCETHRQGHRRRERFKPRADRSLD